MDPHKWLFAPLDCCALLYRNPKLARKTHTQHASYLDVLHVADDEGEVEWNPSDYAVHLSRRARGFPLWYSLAVHGTELYADAIDVAVDIAEATAALIGSLDYVELVPRPDALDRALPSRRAGSAEDYYRVVAQAPGATRSPRDARPSGRARPSRASRSSPRHDRSRWWPRILDSMR